MRRLYLSLCLLLALLLIPYAYSLGVSTPYYIGHSLEMYPGQTLEFNVYIANEGSQETTISANITTSSDIASFEGESNLYVVPPNVNNYPVKIIVKIPQEISIGTEYTITAVFNEVKSASGNGMISMGSGVGRYIPVVIKTKNEVLGIPTPQPKKGLPWQTAIGVLAIIILIVAFILIRKMKSKPVQTVEEQTPPEASTEPPTAPKEKKK